MGEDMLPEGFEDLAPFLGWALEPERARTAKKAESPMEEIRAFYDAMMPRLRDILRHLEPCFGEDMPAPTRNLYLLSLSLVEVSTLVELYKRREAVDACDPLRYVAQR